MGFLDLLTCAGTWSREPTRRSARWWGARGFRASGPVIGAFTRRRWESPAQGRLASVHVDVVSL
jgi:hypothetical protein